MIMALISHPYEGALGLEVCFLFIVRFFSWITGALSLEELAPDEWQILSLIGMGISSCWVGTFLILRKKAMVAGALSHTVLLGLILAVLALHELGFSVDYSLDAGPGILFLAALASAWITFLFLKGFSHTLRLQHEASLGLAFTFLFAVAICLITAKTENLHIGIDIIFGNVDAVNASDVTQSLGAAALMSVMMLFLYKPLVYTSFDPTYMQGIAPKTTLWMERWLLLTTSVTLLLCAKALGVVIALGFLTAPYLVARAISHKLSLIILLSMLLVVICSIASVAITRHVLSLYHLALSTSGTLSLLLTLFVCLTFGFTLKRGSARIAL